MKRYWISSSMIVALLFFIVASTANHQAPFGNDAINFDVDPVAVDTQRTFLGADRCRTCHRKEEDGEQYSIWENSKHAKAFATLGTDKAKEIAAAKGIDNPQTADACLKCHVTGHGVAAEFLGPKYDATQGVTCESCHGAGGDYYKKATMTSITAGEITGESVGLVRPNEAVCAQCHNEESPSFAGFDFDEMVKKIAHPIPEGSE